MINNFQNSWLQLAQRQLFKGISTSGGKLIGQWGRTHHPIAEHYMEDGGEFQLFFLIFCQVLFSDSGSSDFQPGCPTNRWSSGHCRCSAEWVVASGAAPYRRGEGLLGDSVSWCWWWLPQWYFNQPLVGRTKHNWLNSAKPRRSTSLLTSSNLQNSWFYGETSTPPPLTEKKNQN